MANGTNIQEPPSSQPPADVGLVCRWCGCKHFYVIYTRRALGGKLIRRRECRNCEKRVTTVEQEQ